jgi:hypothetical protein
MSYTELRSKDVKVRKPRGCEWCAERINAGESAHYRAYVFEGDFMTGYMHPECHQDMLAYPDTRDLADGWTPGDFDRPAASMANTKEGGDD